MRALTWPGWAVLLAAMWAGLLVCVAFIATPAAFSGLPYRDAGRVAAQMLAREAAVSLLLGMAVLMVERRIGRDAADAVGGSQFTTPMLLALGAIACTVVGCYGVLPQMDAARSGQSSLSVGQWHAVSVGFFGLKLLLVLLLARAGVLRLVRPGPLAA
jgi:hypothetical protein